MYRLITITHKTANINHIGKYIPSVNADPVALTSTLRDIKETLAIDELLYLATCNRLTFLMFREKPLDNCFLLQLFGKLHPQIPSHCLQGMLDVLKVYDGEAAVKHIFELVASLDSLVVGEREIITQFRTAYEFCRKRKLSGDNIRVLAKMAIPAAKDVYTRTEIGVNSISVVSLSIQQLMQYQPAKNAKILFIGAGSTNALFGKHIVKKGFKAFVVFNRTEKNAAHLAKKLEGLTGTPVEYHTLAQLPYYKGGFDVIVTCTAAHDPILTTLLYERMLENNSGESSTCESEVSTKRKIIIDLAVPNDVERGLVQNYPVDYIEVERLRTLAAENLALRKKEVGKAVTILEEHIEGFKLAIRQRRIERAMLTIPKEIKAVKSRALNSVFQKEIANMDATSKAVLEKVINYIEKKYIGIPIKIAKNVLEEELTDIS
ncbi:MAG: glutamyl-tRNA reductase [Chitinophagales bacterium]